LECGLLVVERVEVEVEEVKWEMQVVEVAEVEVEGGRAAPDVLNHCGGNNMGADVF